MILDPNPENAAAVSVGQKAVPHDEEKTLPLNTEHVPQKPLVTQSWKSRISTVQEKIQ